MRDLRSPDAQERNDVLWQAEVALQRLRVLLGPQDRLSRQAPRHVPEMAPLESDAGGYGMLARDIQKGDEGVLAHMADRPINGRGLRRRLPGRHLDRTGCGRAHSLHERARAGMAPGAIRMRGRVGGSHGEDARARHGGDGRSARVCEGGECDMADDARPALRLPRLLSGEKVHHEPTETGRRHRALLARKAASKSEGCRRGGDMACRLCDMVREVGALPEGVHLEGREEAVRARAPSQGATRLEQARAIGRALHVRGDGRGAGWHMGLDQ